MASRDIIVIGVGSRRCPQARPYSLLVVEPLPDFSLRLKGSALGRQRPGLLSAIAIAGGPPYFEELCALREPQHPRQQNGSRNGSRL